MPCTGSALAPFPCLKWPIKKNQGRFHGRCTIFFLCIFVLGQFKEKMMSVKGFSVFQHVIYFRLDSRVIAIFQILFKHVAHPSSSLTDSIQCNHIPYFLHQYPQKLFLIWTKFVRKLIEGGNYCKSPFFGIFYQQIFGYLLGFMANFFAKQAENLPKLCAEH